MNRDPGPDERARRDPAFVFDDDGFCDEIECGRLEPVRASAKKCPLRDAHMGTDPHTVETEDHHFLADPHMIADLKPPWKMDIHL